MLRWTLMFLAFGLALAAGVQDFTGLAGHSMPIARILFVLFLIIFVATVVYGLVNGKELRA